MTIGSSARSTMRGSTRLRLMRRWGLRSDLIAKLRADYEKLKASWGGYAAYDNWFKRPINNARLNTIATYETLVPAFKQLLAQDGGDLQKFYTDAKAMAKLAKEPRREQMAALTLASQKMIAEGKAAAAGKPSL